MSRLIRKVVVLGANGAMGAGSGAVFAGAGISTTFLARTREKAEAGLSRAEKMLKSSAIRPLVEIGSYDDLGRAAADADLVFEAVTEDLAVKREIFARVDAVRRSDAIVSSVSSGLSIAAMAEGRSPGFARNFLGIHFFNPPTVIVGCEVVPHVGTDPAVLADVHQLLSKRLGRAVVETSDTPAFCGNRVGFKMLNEVAQLAQEHGVAYLDMLAGPHTGRAMAPLVTVDFVGWDVHRAIVDNLAANTKDEAHDAFALPGYMGRLIARGHLGNKTPGTGGFYKTAGKGPDAQRFVLDPTSGDYRPLSVIEPPDVVKQMRALHHVGRYMDAMDVFATAPGKDAELMRRIILGYVSYGLGRVGEVVRNASGVDRIMGTGFNWAPPGLLVDLIGAARTASLMEKERITVPALIHTAAGQKPAAPLFTEPHVDHGRFFVA